MILASGKTIETINLRQLVSAGPRVDLTRGRLDAHTVELSFFWCVNKGHTLLDCTDPAPNPVSKLTRDELIAPHDKRDRINRNSDRKSCRLVSPASPPSMVAVRVPAGLRNSKTQ